MIFLFVLNFLCVGNELQHRLLAILIRTKPLRAMRLMEASRDQPLCDRGAAINNSGQWCRQPSGNHLERTRDASRTRPTTTDEITDHSTTAGNTKLRGWSGRAQERHTDSPDANINQAKHTPSATVFQL
jgi:hypothetical protein